MNVRQRNQRVTVAMVFVVFLCFAFVLPFLPLYVRSMGVRDEEEVARWAGLQVGITPLLAGLLAPAWGRLAERTGYKILALRALGSYVVLMLLSAFVTSPGQLLALRAAVGLLGGIGPMGLAMATGNAPRELTGRSVGLIQSAQILATAAGPLLGGVLADRAGIRLTFGLAAILCAATFLLVLRFYEEGPRPRPSRAARARSSLGQMLALPQVAPLLVVLFLVSFVGRSFTPILPLHLEQLGLPAARLGLATGMVLSAHSVAAALSATSLGSLCRRRSASTLLLGSLIAGAITVWPMALATSFAAMVTLAVLLGLAAGGSLTLSYTIGGLVVPEESRAAAFGLFSGAALFGGAVSPMVAGLLTHFDLRAIYQLDAALFLLLAAGLLFGPRVAPAIEQHDGGMKNISWVKTE